MRGAEILRVGLIHAQRAALRNGHKPSWKPTSRRERDDKVIEEVFEALDSLWDEDATNEEKLMELGDAIWSLVMLYDNEDLLGGDDG